MTVPVATAISVATAMSGLRTVVPRWLRGELPVVRGVQVGARKRTRRMI